jgi:hypothetical protein
VVPNLSSTCHQPKESSSKQKRLDSNNYLATVDKEKQLIVANDPSTLTYTTYTLFIYLGGPGESRETFGGVVKSDVG